MEEDDLIVAKIAEESAVVVTRPLMKYDGTGEMKWKPEKTGTKYDVMMSDANDPRSWKLHVVKLYEKTPLLSECYNGNIECDFVMKSNDKGELIVRDIQYDGDNHHYDPKTGYWKTNAIGKEWKIEVYEHEKEKCNCVIT